MGNLDVKRDWGYAPEYVEVMRKISLIDNPEDFIIGTNETHIIREFLNHGFDYLDLDREKFVKTNPRYLRPSAIENLCADIFRIYLTCLDGKRNKRTKKLRYEIL